ELTHVVQQENRSAPAHLEVGHQRDSLEQNAELVAHQVVNPRDSSMPNHIASAGTQVVQRYTGLVAATEESTSAIESPTTQSQQRYDLTVGTEVLENATAEQVLQVLWRHYHRIRNWVERCQSSHVYLQQIRDDQWVVGFYADLLGRVTMPDLG